MIKYKKALEDYCAFERDTNEKETKEEQERYDLLLELVDLSDLCSQLENTESINHDTIILIKKLLGGKKNDN